MTEPTGPDEPNIESAPPTPEEHPLAGMARAFKRFLVPFLLSFVLAYVGGNLQLEWMYFAGLTGVGLSMIVFLVWLIS